MSAIQEANHFPTAASLIDMIDALVGQAIKDITIAEAQALHCLDTVNCLRLIRFDSDVQRWIRVGAEQPDNVDAKNRTEGFAPPVQSADNSFLARGGQYAVEFVSADLVQSPVHATSLPNCSAAPECHAALTRLCTWLELVRSLTESDLELSDYREESELVKALAVQVLSVQDLEQVLLTITTETLRMSVSDICGVFLRDGDDLYMRSCTGHRLTETSQLKMGRRQGVAGMVLDTWQPQKVDSYVDDEVISKDFMSLAEQEETRSALAVPLIRGNDLVGVLEVWRRRISVFTERDVRRLEALASFATIAIVNARLYDEQRWTLTELEEAQTRLHSQISLLDETSALQRAFINVVLDNGPVVTQIARILAEHLDTSATIVSADTTISGSFPHDTDPEPFLEAVRIAGGSKHRQSEHRDAGVYDTENGTPVLVRFIEIGNERLGAVCVSGKNASSDRWQIACTQASLACSLFYLQQRAASRARAEALDQILWELLNGTAEQRLAASARAQEMGVWLRGPHRVLFGSVNCTGPGTDDEVSRDSQSQDVSYRALLDSMRSVTDPVQATLVSRRGNKLVALVPIEDRDNAYAYLNAVTSMLASAFPNLSVAWGMSEPRSSPSEFDEASREASTALEAARRLGDVSLYDDLGIMRLLLGNEDSDFRAFVDEVTRPLIDYDLATGGELIKTLRAYFEANCSQKDAAELLFVHHKTLAYRLNRIHELTGLDLSQHADRLRADLALRLFEITASNKRDK